MKTFFKTALIAATLIMSATSLQAGQYVTRGFGTMTCRQAVKVTNDGPGNLLMMAYVGGFLDAVNGLSSDHLPSSNDVANQETTENIVKMVRVTCKKHPSIEFDHSLTTILSRLKANADKDDELEKGTERID